MTDFHLSSVWVVVVSYLDADGRPQLVSDKKSKIDYCGVQSEPDFQIYAKLRVLRKLLAEQAGVPTYALFNNQHLATMVQQRVTTVVVFPLTIS